MERADAKVALVTGGSSGIGGIGRGELQDAGFTVYAVARRVERMAALQAERGPHVFAMDVTDDASMVAGVERIVDEQGRLDVLVNNAGYGSYGAVEDVPIDEARRQFEVNVFGLARLTQLVTPHMRAQGIGPDHQRHPRSAASSTSRSVPGTTRPSSRSRASATACAMELQAVRHRRGRDRAGPIVTEWNEIARDSLLERSGGDGVRQVREARPPGAGGSRTSPGHDALDTPERRRPARSPRRRPSGIRPPATRWAREPGRSPRVATCSPTRCSTRSISRTYGSR